MYVWLIIALFVLLGFVAAARCDSTKEKAANIALMVVLCVATVSIVAFIHVAMEKPIEGAIDWHRPSVGCNK